MTVKELIAKLSKLDQEMEIMNEVDRPHSEAFAKPIYDIGQNLIDEDGYYNYEDDFDISRREVYVIY